MRRLWRRRDGCRCGHTHDPETGRCLALDHGWIAGSDHQWPCGCTRVIRSL